VARIHSTAYPTSRPEPRSVAVLSFRSVMNDGSEDLAEDSWTTRINARDGAPADDGQQPPHEPRFGDEDEWPTVQAPAFSAKLAFWDARDHGCLADDALDEIPFVLLPPPSAGPMCAPGAPVSDPEEPSDLREEDPNREANSSS
jgi:hypothetical protein